MNRLFRLGAGLVRAQLSAVLILSVCFAPDRIDLNTAPAAELMRLPGVGATLAARIIEHRRRHGPFRRPQDVIIVRGMSAARYRLIAPLVRAS